MEETESVNARKISLSNPAQNYQESLAPLQNPDGLQFLNSLTVVEGSKVLDLGCATGNHSVELAKRVGSKGQVVGVDPNRERIKLAKEVNKKDNIVYYEACGETFPEDQYDLVFSNMVIHWIENKDAVFKRVYNNLRPGGVFAFTTNLDTPPLIGEIINTMTVPTQEELMSNRFFLTVEQLKDLATKNGFTVTIVETSFNQYSMPSIDVAIKFALNGRFVAPMANEDALKALKKKYGQEPVHYLERFVICILTKTV